MAQTLDLIPHFVIKLFQQKRFAAGVAFASGCLASVAMAPLNIWAALIVSLPCLYLLVLYSRSSRFAGVLGWLFGFGYFSFSLSWIGNALLVDGNPYKWAWIFAVSGLPALLAFFPAMAVGLAKAFCNLRTFRGWIGFISIFCLFELLRGHVFTGFPWNLMGYTWSDTLPVIQILWLSDVYFLTWLTMLWLSLPACIVFQNTKQIRIACLISILSFTGCFIFGIIRLQEPESYVPDTSIKIVQPNIKQSEKWEASKTQSHLDKLLELSRRKGADRFQRTLIIWPETAMNFRMTHDFNAAEDIAAMLRSYSGDAKLITGMLRYNRVYSQYTNSTVMFHAEGLEQNIYDKHHLVPFGEYIPFQKWIPLAPVVKFKGFETGDGPSTLKAYDNLRYSPLICYEIIFPGKSLNTDTKDHHAPDFILNVTNDAWYGESAGPHQHLSKAVYRAIESGLPVIRSANTGFSAIISPFGRISGKQVLFQELSEELVLPTKNIPVSIVLQFKHKFVMVFLLLFSIAGCQAQRQIANTD